MQTEARIFTSPKYAQAIESKPSLANFMERHRLPQDLAARVLRIADNVDKADAIAELMR